MPIIALTAGALSSERQRATAAGMDDYLVKPFDAQSLVASILRRIAPPSAQPARPAAGSPETRKPKALPWLEIEGIDSGDARDRLDDDFGLFRSMLKRLLDEFSNVSIPTAGDGPPELAVHAGRMHKLRGSAGMLGAKAIHHLAGEAEAACIAGEVDRSTSLAMRLAIKLERLAQSAATALMTAPMVPAEPSALGGAELDPQVLADFVDLLRQQSMSAMERFGSLFPHLQLLLSKGSFELVRDHMENLRFRDAADVLAGQLSIAEFSRA
jgi:CheY-like chemotaxis protein